MPTLQMSSEQKILSQQMSHWSLEMVLTKDEQEKKRLKDTLFVSLRKLNTNYRKLSQDADEMAKDLIQDEKILKMYRSRPLNIDLHLETFQDTIMGLLNLRTTQISSLEKEYISIIKNLANNKLWNGFDAVLKEYNNSSKQRIDKVQNVSFKISLAILIVLLLEGLFLFRPMVKTIATEKQNLLHSQRLVNSVMKTVAEGIITINRKHEIIMVNEEINNDWGYSLKELHKKQCKIKPTPLILKKHPCWK